VRHDEVDNGTQNGGDAMADDGPKPDIRHDDSHYAQEQPEFMQSLLPGIVPHHLMRQLVDACLDCFSQRFHFALPFPITFSLAKEWGDNCFQNNALCVKCRLAFVSDADRHDKVRERPALHLPEQVAGYALTVSVLTVLGPFSTFQLPPATRAAYWALSIGGGWALILGLILTARRLKVFEDRPLILRPLTALALGFVPIVFIAMQVDTLFRPDDGKAPIWAMLVNAGTIFALVTGILMARIRPRLTTPAPVPARNAFLDRLPPQLGTALISLTAQDHYVEVTTAKGRDLIHMRLSDAIKELADYPGLQIHRSHWISGHAFTGTSRENGNLVAHTADGRTLPVSRSCASEVRRMQPVRPMPMRQ